MAKLFFSLGALLSGFAVILGAWASHGGESMLSAEQLGLVHKGVRYQMHHGLGLLAVAWAVEYWSVAGWPLTLSGWLLVAGTVLFSGSLYILAFGLANPGYITPVGGSLMILGWFGLALSIWKG